MALNKNHRRHHIRNSLRQLGYKTTADLSKALKTTERRVDTWINEGRVPRHVIPDLIILCRKRGRQLPYLLLVEPHARKSEWSIERVVLENLLILLGGHTVVAEDVGISPRMVKYWGQYEASIPYDHIKPFLTLCRKRYKQYTGKKLIADGLQDVVNAFMRAGLL